MTRLILFLCILVLYARPSAAQRPHLSVSGPSPSLLFAFRPSAALDTSARVIRPTHWQRGLLIGGTVGGVALGFLGYALCHDLSETHQSCFGPALGGAALGAVIGGVTGALIGGAFRKDEPTDSLAATP